MTSSHRTFFTESLSTRSGPKHSRMHNTVHCCHGYELFTHTLHRGPSNVEGETSPRAGLPQYRPNPRDGGQANTGVSCGELILLTQMSLLGLLSSVFEEIAQYIPQKWKANPRFFKDGGLKPFFFCKFLETFAKSDKANHKQTFNNAKNAILSLKIRVLIFRP